MDTISASEFKAKCLAILDRVQQTGEHVVILKRGRPVAELSPPQVTEGAYPQRDLVGTVTITDDIVDPVLPEQDWEALR